MKTVNKKGFTIVELIIGLAILSVLIGTVAVNGYAAYKNSLDQGIREDLKALSQATTMFMVSNNGVAPCFSPEMAEWVLASDANNVLCANTGYDYVQGNWTGAAVNTATTISLDEDDTNGEVFTFNNILVPTYLDKLPLPRRGGQNYIYTKGIPDTSAGSSSFAYSTILAGSQATKILKNNISVVNVAVADANAANAVNFTACSDAQVDFGTTAITPTTALTNPPHPDDQTLGLKYYKYAAISGGLIKTAITSAATACDVYSDGQGILLGNFTDTQWGASESVSITVNAK